MYVFGNLTVQGSGDLTIAIQSYEYVFGMFAAYGMEFYGGAVMLRCQAATVSGLTSDNGDIVIDGTQIDIVISGDGCDGIDVSTETLLLKSGSLYVDVKSTQAYAAGVMTSLVSLEGGTLEAHSSGAGACHGLMYVDGTLNAAGGTFIMTGSTSAIARYFTGTDLAAPAAGMDVYVSSAQDGSGKTQWYSSADGNLASLFYSSSPFHYVEFSPTPPPPTPVPTATPTPTPEPPPKTGDTATPWLWLGLLLLSVAGTAGIMALVWRRKAT